MSDPKSRARRRVLAVVRGLTALGAAVMGVGCSVARTPPVHESRREVVNASGPVGSEAWPARWTAGLRDSIVISDEHAPAELELPPEMGGKKVIVGWPVARRLIATATGLIDFIVPRLGIDSEGRTVIQSEDLSGVHTFRYANWRPDQPPVWGLPEPGSEDPNDSYVLDRAYNRASIIARFRLLMPGVGQDAPAGSEEAAPGPEPKGLILFVPPISDAKWSVPVPRELLRRGWAVLSVDNLNVAQSARVAMTIDVPWVDAKKTRTTVVRPDATLPPEIGGRWMGEWLRDDMADIAYAYEAGLDFALRSEPVLTGKPVVVIGASLGGIFTPPLVARLGERVSAAVVIGGGANMLGIISSTDRDVFSATLSIRDSQIPVRGPAAEKWKDVYLQTNRLDPFHTAGALARIPTLIIDAGRDGIIKPEYGQALWEHAGKPERWTVDCGHIWLFITLKDRAKGIADWVEGAVEESRAGGA